MSYGDRMNERCVSYGGGGIYGGGMKYMLWTRGELRVEG